MNLSTARPSINSPLRIFSGVHVRSGMVYGLIIVMAMIAFESFNYATTAYALRDLLGDLSFAGIPWATFLAMAFCGLDFAGIASLITQPGNRQANRDSWYLFGAWLIAGTVNAALTWWGVSIALTNHAMSSSAFVSTTTLVKMVPIFVAIMVWIIRVLIIGSLSTALERMARDRRPAAAASQRTNAVTHAYQQAARPVPTASMRSAAYPRSAAPSTPVYRNRTEPTYHNLSASESFDSASQDTSTRRM